MMKKPDIPAIIPAATAAGILLSLSTMFTGVRGAAPFLLLFLLPLVCCAGLALTRHWAFGAAYLALFLLVRSGVFLGRYTLLATVLIALWAFLFAWATVAAALHKKTAGRKSTVTDEDVLAGIFEK